MRTGVLRPTPTHARARQCGLSQRAIGWSRLGTIRRRRPPLVALMPLQFRRRIKFQGTKATWSGHAGGHLSDDEAQAGAVSIEDRRGEFRRPDSRAVPQERAENTVQRVNPLGLGVNRAHGPTLFARARVPRPPHRVASLARRTHLAASGPMPQSLVARFTTGEAVLRLSPTRCVTKAAVIGPMPSSRRGQG
jgi:hypothetical protein